jgi:hypothetical protein
MLSTRWHLDESSIGEGLLECDVTRRPRTSEMSRGPVGGGSYDETMMAAKTRLAVLSSDD